MTPISDYGPADYDAMFADAVRTPAYLRAIAVVVRPGDVVVEIGTGVGYFAVAAHRAGARHVYAIELSAAVVLAREIIRENGCADRVTIIHGDANRVALPERGTVLISDLRGILPLFGDAIATIARARERVLEPGARLIPLRDVIHAAPCAAPARWSRTELALGDAPAGIARGASARHARAWMHRDRIAPELICAAPAQVAAFDYALNPPANVDASVDWAIEKAGPVAGIGLWFDSELCDGIGFSTAPGGPPTVYGHGFLPFERAIDALPGDRLACRVRATLVDGSYVFAWDTEFRPAGPGRGSVMMRQSTVASILASPSDLAQRQSAFRPDPAALALVRDFLRLADGERTLSEIAGTLARAHPGRFETAAAALAWVTRTHAEMAGADGR